MKNKITEFLDKHIVIVFLCPILIPYTLFLIIPLMSNFFLSLVVWRGVNFRNIQFVGLNNYLELSRDPIFWKSIFNNIIFLIFALAIQAPFSLFLAIILYLGPRFSGFFRGVIILPMTLSFVAVSLLFGFFLAPSTSGGIINITLEKIGLRDWTHAWLGEKEFALYSLIGIHLWRETGYTTLLLLAALSTIPEEICESAKVEGAAMRHIVWYIILPLLRESYIVVTIFAGILALRVFEYIYILTRGGPYHATEVVVTYLYRQAFAGGRMGYASAISVVFFLIVLFFVIFSRKLLKAEMS